MNPGGVLPLKGQRGFRFLLMEARTRASEITSSQSRVGTQQTAQGGVASQLPMTNVILKDQKDSSNAC